MSVCVSPRDTCKLWVSLDTVRGIPVLDSSDNYKLPIPGVKLPWLSSNSEYLARIAYKRVAALRRRSQERPLHIKDDRIWPARTSGPSEVLQLDLTTRSWSGRWPFQYVTILWRSLVTTLGGWWKPLIPKPPEHHSLAGYDDWLVCRFSLAAKTATVIPDTVSFSDTLWYLGTTLELAIPWI